jgi:hypothetical protein
MLSVSFPPCTALSPLQILFPFSSHHANNQIKFGEEKVQYKGETRLKAYLKRKRGRIFSCSHDSFSSPNFISLLFSPCQQPTQIQLQPRPNLVGSEDGEKRREIKFGEEKVQYKGETRLKAYLKRKRGRILLKKECPVLLQKS